MDNKHDKLDDFLRDQLNDSSENPSWNVPGDHVFENAMNALPKKKKNNRRFWLILPLLFLAVLVGREFMHMNQINSLESKIANLEESINTTSDIENTSVHQINTINNNAGEQATPSGINSVTITGGQTLSQNDNNPSIDEQPTKENSLANKEIKEQSSVASSEVKVGTKISSGTFSDNNSKVPFKTTDIQQAQYSINNNQATLQGSSINANSVVTTTPDNKSSESLIQTTSLNKELHWLTPAITQLPFAGLNTNERNVEIQNSVPSVIVSVPSNTTLPLQYGILVGGNSSWLTMQNIPQGATANLYNYDNHQPGANAYAFLEKPLSKKFSVQAGIGYQFYQNQSILEEEFLFDEDNVVTMDGKEFYMSPIDVINPLGDIASMLDFRVSDQMHQNDILSEYTTMKQQLHAVHFDISIGYKLATFNRFELSAGAGFSVGYLAGIDNDFTMSCYHNGQLQSSRKETPKELMDSQKWYGQAIGRLDLSYQLTDRMNLVLETQYRGGISSLRRGTEANGSQTYLHSFGLSAGLKHNF